MFLSAAPIPGKYSDAFATIAKNERIWLAAGLAEQGPEAGLGSQKGSHQAWNSSSIAILCFVKGDQSSLHVDLIPVQIDDFAKSHPRS